jgi:hypothetical protein
VLYYDSEGVAQAIGAEAVRDSIEEIAKDKGWIKVSWYASLQCQTSPLISLGRFKLHLAPKTNEPAFITALENHPLPNGLTVIDVFADLLRYLYRCTEDYLKQSHASGELLWTSLQKRTHFVLTHPNGWGGPQQNQLKEAAVKAGLVPDMDVANVIVSFVTEGEASLNYCICSGLSKEAFKVRPLLCVACSAPIIITE